MKIMYVYILKCSDNTYYTGVTNNLDFRLKQHRLGIPIGSYTFYRRPVELVYHDIFYDPLQAIEFEKKLKGWSRSKKDAIIKDQWELLYELSECRNSSSHKNFKK